MSRPLRQESFAEGSHEAWGHFGTKTELDPSGYLHDVASYEVLKVQAAHGATSVRLDRSDQRHLRTLWLTCRNSFGEMMALEVGSYSPESNRTHFAHS